MTRILVFALCPLPFENTQKNFGPGIRAWQFVKPLLDRGDSVVLIANRIPFIYPAETPPEVKTVSDRFTFYNMNDRMFRDTRRIQDIHDRFQPDAILAATIFATPPLAALNYDCPVWIDLFGHVMAEAQAKAYRYGDNAYLEHFRRHEMQAIGIGDVFSTVSRAQGFATIGELGLINRLNNETTGYRFCHTIPCAMDPVLYTHEKTVFRGGEVPEDAFVVLWSGGYNTWTDTDTLFAGLEYAMAENPDIWFVSTGGQIDGHDELTYPAFVEKTRRSRFRNRFVFRGWVPKSDVHNYYFESNIGINIDRYMYEGMLGSKNRVLDWMRADLPGLIGELCELSVDLPKEGLAYSYPLHDPEALGRKIIELASDPASVADTGRRAREYGLKHLNFHGTTRVFREWCHHPEPAPDHAGGIRGTNGHPDNNHGNDYIQSLLSQIDRKNHHIEQLEKYVRHLEKEIISHSDGAGIPAESVQRPSLKGIPLSLPTQPRVTVILVTWNGIQYIDECLQSVMTHDYPDIECIVVDNGSTDGTPDRVESGYPDIRLIRNLRNRGFTRGVNQALEAASGDVIFLLNQDAVMKPGLLNALIDALRDPQVAIAGCKIFDPDGKTLQHAGGILHDNGLTDHYGAGELDSGRYDEDRDVDYVTGAAMGFKHQLVGEIGHFDPRYSPAYFEELDYCLRATRAGYRIRYVHRAQAYHYESTSTGKFSRRFYQLYHRNRLKFMLKHYSARYFLGPFRRFEWQWFRRHAPREQVLPLLLAYLAVLHRFVWVFLRSAKGRLLT